MSYLNDEYWINARSAIEQMPADGPPSKFELWERACLRWSDPLTGDPIDKEVRYRALSKAWWELVIDMARSSRLIDLKPFWGYVDRPS